MIRYTTPTHIFKANIDLTNAETIFLTYKQNNSTVVEKTREDLEVTETAVTVTLTQEDTGKFVPGAQVEIQFRAKFYDGTAVASNIMKTSVERVLKDGVI